MISLFERGVRRDEGLYFFVGHEGFSGVLGWMKSWIKRNTCLWKNKNEGHDIAG